jgi:hypothetical protein
MKRILFGVLAFCLVVITVFAEDKQTPPQPTTPRADSADQRAKLAELNKAIYDLESRINEARSKKEQLEAERTRILSEVKTAQSEAVLDGSIVVRIHDHMTVILLAGGQEKIFRLSEMSVNPGKEDQAKTFLKTALIEGTAYVKCDDPICAWGLLFADRKGQSLNAQMVSAGLARSWGTSPEVPTTSETQSETSQQSETTATPSSSSPRSTPGTDVHVKGYYRKDGTYVRPHTRSAPGSKKKP